MPNTDVKRGLVPVRHATGSPYMGAMNKYSVPATNTDTLFVGDPVTITGDADADGYASVGLAAAAVAFTGVIVGIEPTQDKDQLGYVPANTAAVVHVADEDSLECEIQANAAITSAMIGSNAGLALAAGDTAYRRSQTELDVASVAPTATLPLQIIGVMNRADNDPYDAGGNAKVRVRINNGKAGV